MLLIINKKSINKKIKQKHTNMLKVTSGTVKFLSILYSSLIWLNVGFINPKYLTHIRPPFQESYPN